MTDNNERKHIQSLCETGSEEIHYIVGHVENRPDAVLQFNKHGYDWVGIGYENKNYHVFKKRKNLR